MAKEVKNCWDKYDEKGIEKIFTFCNGYREFISNCKTERECVKETIRIVEKLGYVNLDQLIKEEIGILTEVYG